MPGQIGMSQLSTILRSAQGGVLIFWCPGCKESHAIGTGDGPGPRWRWNGDATRPTFEPSIKVQGVRAPSGRDVMTDEEEAEYDAIYARGGRAAVFASRFGTCCHSFVRDGRIQFLDDCSHELAGQTVDLPAWPARSE